MAFAVFGPGSLYLTRTDTTTPQSYNIGYCQSFQLEESADVKQLYGQNQYPLVAARSTMKVTGKAVAAEISGLALNAVMHGMAFTSGISAYVPAETSVIPSTPFQVTAVNGANFDQDLGVIFTLTSLPLIRVASGPTTGQYSVNTTTGVYTFASADATKSITLSYAWANASVGQSRVVTSQPIGTNPVFQLDYATSLNNIPYYLRIYQCVAAKLARSFKLTDFMMPEVDFDVFANAAGQVYKESTGQVS